MKYTGFIVCFLLLALSPGEVNSQENFLENAASRYPELAKCEIPGFSEKVLCGTLQVVENRITGHGRKIPIEVVVIPSTSSDPLASAFTKHVGGNGMGAKDKIWSFFPDRPPADLRALQDIVLIDDRGTGASNIRCTAMDSLKPQNYVLAYDKTLIEACLSEVRGKVDLSLYNTPAVVNDYEEVREWLGIPQFDFYGPSYGVRVGLEYLRLFPNSLRTVTLHGSVPPDFNYVNEMDGAIQEQLENLIMRCENDSICKKYYPDFGQELYAVRDRLRTQPETVKYQLENGKAVEIVIDDYVYRRIIAHEILNGNALGSLPLLVHRAYQGNLAVLITASTGLNLDMPVFLSQFCPEEIDRFEFREDSIKSLNFFTQGAIGREKVSACEWWMDMPAADWLDEPIDSDIPMLILTGEYDANTPIRMGDKVHERFPMTSRHIIMPHQGHGGTLDMECRYDLISQFIRTRELSLQTACLDSVPSAPFAWEQPLSEDEFSKYIGSYHTDDPEKKLELFSRNGVYYMNDEFSQYTGPSLLLYRGNDSFSLLDCEHCQLIFTIDNGNVLSVNRKYRELSVFIPKD